VYEVLEKMARVHWCICVYKWIVIIL
jgi:hypothetical protein